MKISDGLLHKQFHFVLCSQKTFTFYWIRNLKRWQCQYCKDSFFYWTQHTVSLLSDPEEATWVSVGKLGHSIWRKEYADRFTSGRVQVLSKKWKYCRYKQRFIRTSTESNKIAGWSSLNKITRARFFETPSSFETPSKRFYKSTRFQIFAQKWPRNKLQHSKWVQNQTGF